MRLAVGTWGQPCPAFEGTVEGAGFRKPHAGCHFEQRQVGLGEVLDGHVAAQHVLDHLVALPFALQAAAQGLGRGGQHVADDFERGHLLGQKMTLRQNVSPRLQVHVGRCLQVRLVWVSAQSH